ncbi:MAG: hypothetical protein IT423_19870 [Pirellulaceae bacterium]|nr:hypothetical protein [Pirellulaceae bacterium]
MSTPKRWYQLSMLQMLVAMAVVAVWTRRFASVNSWLVKFKCIADQLGLVWTCTHLIVYGR